MRYIKFLTILIFPTFLLAENIHANEYIAFSLKVAQQMILSTPQGKDYRKLHPEVFTLGGITAMKGLVYDRKTSDVILVGQRDPERAILTLDDFVVALRARFIHGKWPLVSIDPMPETEKTQMQVVRFEGGIEDTQFGQDLFDADYRLKQIGMGLLHSGVPGFKSDWDLGMERAKQQTSKSWNISSRFWFYPVLPNVSVREDVVAIKGLKVGVFTEVMSAEIDGKKIEDPKPFQDTAGDEFAKQVTDKFDALSKAHPSFSRVHGLDELIALVNAIENMDERLDLDWWLMKYQVKKVDTKRKVEVLTRHEDYKVPVSDGYYKERRHEVSGGVELMAISLRLKAGNVAALKEAVLKTKPKPDALIWGFMIGEWLIPTAPSVLTIEDVVPLFAQAEFLTEKKHYDNAITIYGKIIELMLDFYPAYVNRGGLLFLKGEFDLAISDFNQGIVMNPRCFECYHNRGNVYASDGKYALAISDYNMSLQINPYKEESYICRGVIFERKGDYNHALSDFSKALEINPNRFEAYYNRGVAYYNKSKYEQSIFDFNKVLELNPRSANAYVYLGVAYAQKGQYDAAISAFDRAVEIDPRRTDAYYNKVVVCKKAGRERECLEAYKRLMQIQKQKLHPPSYVETQKLWP